MKPVSMGRPGMSSRPRRQLLTALLMVCGPSAFAAHPDDLGLPWMPIDQDSAADLIDDASDPESPGTETADIVGASGATAAYWWADPEHVCVRMRLRTSPIDSGASNPVDFPLRPNLYAAVFDLDGDLSHLDAGLFLVNQGERIRLRDNASTDSPPGEEWSETAESELSSTGTAWSTNLARASSAGTAIGSSTNWFLDFCQDRATLQSVLFLGDTDIFRMAFGTSHAIDGGDSEYSIRTDLAGADNEGSFVLEDGWSSELTLDKDEDGLSDPEEAAYGTLRENTDSDGDGLTDGEEVHPTGTTPATNPANADTDEDGLFDGDELAFGTDPTVQDSDGDGISDREEYDCGGGDSDDRDGDGVPDITEQGGATAHWNSDDDDDPDWCDEDDDNDTIPTSVEGAGDTDDDLTPDYLDLDSDDDSVDDETEGTGDNDCDGVRNFQDKEDEDGPCGDWDNDGSNNAQEEECGTDPRDEDTDGDGILDGYESCLDDSDGDGIPDALDPTDDSNKDGTGPYGDDGTALVGGYLKGGGCSTAGGSGGPMGLLLAGLGGMALLARRRRRFAALAAMLPGVSLADDNDVNAQLFQPAMGEDDFIRADDTEAGPGTGGFALWFNHASKPLVYAYEDGRDPVDLLGSVGTLDMQGWFATGPVRLGIDLPLHTYATGYELDNAGSYVLGDIRGDLKWEIVPRGDGGLGLALAGGIGLPTGNGAAFLGEPGVSGTVRAIGSLRANNTLLVANLGWGASPATDLPGGGVWGQRLIWAAGVHQDLNPAWALAAELNGAAFLGGAAPGGSVPLEATASGSWQASKNIALRLGVGKGITGGMGSPAVRAILGLEGRFGAGLEDQAPAPGAVQSAISFIGPDGSTIAGVKFKLVSGPRTGSWTSPAEGALMLDLPPGSYDTLVSFPGYVSIAGRIDVPEGEAYARRFDLKPESGRCNIRFQIHDERGRPLDAEVRNMNGGPSIRAESDTGVASLRIREGKAEEYVISATGFSPEHRAVSCQRDDSGLLTNEGREVVLQPPRARLEGERITLSGRVHFGLDSAELLPKGKGLLDDVAAILRNHPELLDVEIQGHTDVSGRPEYNLSLSQQRAAAVKAYLVDVQGITSGRLSASGLGESRPLRSGSSEEDHEANRRVEFHIRRTTSP